MLLPNDVNAYLYNEPCDMRKSINSLSILVVEALQQNPASGDLFIFRNRRCDKLKILYYEQNCFNLLYRRLESGKYIMPKDMHGKISMTREHFSWLLASDKYSRLQSNSPKEYDCFY